MRRAQRFFETSLHDYADVCRPRPCVKTQIP